MTRRLTMVMCVALGLSTVACGDDDDDGVTPPVDAGGDGVDAGGDGVDAGGDDVDAGDGVDGGGDVEPSVTVEDPFEVELSTVVTVPEAVSNGPGFLVIHEDDGGSPGPVIGNSPLDPGTNTDVDIALDRPAEDGETLHAMVHVDEGEIGTYEFPGADGPAMADGAVVVEPFVVSVPEGTPAVRINLTNVGTTSWVLESTEPAAFAPDIIGEGTEDQEMTLQSGWRYEIVNPVPGVHPFEIITMGGTPAADVVLLSQAAEGTLEGNANVDWEEVDDNTMRFTTAAALTGTANGYRCEAHTMNMRGDLSFE